MLLRGVQAYLLCRLCCFLRKVRAYQSLLQELAQEYQSEYQSFLQELAQAYLQPLYALHRHYSLRAVLLRLGLRLFE